MFDYIMFLNFCKWHQEVCRHRAEFSFQVLMRLISFGRQKSARLDSVGSNLTNSLFLLFGNLCMIVILWRVRDEGTKPCTHNTHANVAWGHIGIAARHALLTQRSIMVSILYTMSQLFAAHTTNALAIHSCLTLCFY